MSIFEAAGHLRAAPGFCSEEALRHGPRPLTYIAVSKPSHLRSGSDPITCGESKTVDATAEPGGPTSEGQGSGLDLGIRRCIA
jgi:hypothetical protein